MAAPNPIFDFNFIQQNNIKGNQFKIHIRTYTYSEVCLGFFSSGVESRLGHNTQEEGQNIL